MHIAGYAMQAHEKDIRESRHKRFQELKKLDEPLVDVERRDLRGRRIWIGTIRQKTPVLSPLDIGLLAGHSYFPFGGSVHIQGDRFEVTEFTN